LSRRVIPRHGSAAQWDAAAPIGNKGFACKRPSSKAGRPVHNHNAAYFLGSLILLLLPAFADLSAAASLNPRANMKTEGGEPLAMGGIALIGSPPSPLGPKRPSRRKPFIFNSRGHENRLYPSGRQVTTWRIEPPPMRPPIRSPLSTWGSGLAGDNSGSPRRSYGARSPRGPQTFLPAADFDGTPCQVVELTFESELALPAATEVGLCTSGPWRSLEDASSGFGPRETLQD